MKKNIRKRNFFEVPKRQRQAGENTHVDSGMCIPRTTIVQASKRGLREVGPRDELCESF